MREMLSGWNVSRRSALLGTGAAGLATLGQLADITRAGAQEATPAACGTVEANKELVRRFYDAFYEAAHTGNVDLIEPFVAADYIQHEQDVGPGRDGLKALLRQMAGRPSAAPPPLLHLIADGDIVAAHQIVPGADPSGPLRAEGVDIFRIANGQLVEHWGVDVDYGETSSG